MAGRRNVTSILCFAWCPDLSDPAANLRQCGLDRLVFGASMRTLRFSSSSSAMSARSVLVWPTDRQAVVPRPGDVRCRQVSQWSEFSDLIQRCSGIYGERECIAGANQRKALSALRLAVTPARVRPRLASMISGRGRSWARTSWRGPLGADALGRRTLLAPDALGAGRVIRPKQS